MMLFDTHTHLSDTQFDTDRQDIIDSFCAEDIAGIIEVGTDITDSTFAAKLAVENHRVYAAAGIHPHEASKANADYLDALSDMLCQKKVVAVGEIGLDFHYDFSPRDVQQAVFEDQLALAADLDMPVIIHSREATLPMMNTLKKFSKLKGVMHCFSGSVETAKECVKLGLYISFTGPLTFKNAAKVRNACMAVPLDRLMAETDCPYMSPVPMRGKRNEPKHVAHTLRKMAEIKNISFEKMCDINIKNAKKLFKVEIND
jgi:TatD DNase family protein